MPDETSRARLAGLARAPGKAVERRPLAVLVVAAATLGLADGDRPYWETDCGRLGPALEALAERYG